MRAFRSISQAEITNLDLVTLRHFAEAEERDAPTPPAFVDTLLRLSRLGFLQGDDERRFRITENGRLVLKEKLAPTH